MAGREAAHPDWVAYEPALLPSLARMASEGIGVLEEWFRWGEEWSMLLRVYGNLGFSSRVLEIGCGQGRVAFALRYIIGGGPYIGFDIDRDKIEFLQRTFHPAHANFAFYWADVRNSFYNPSGRLAASGYRFPVPDQSQDLVFAASVFTHMVPENTAHYFEESARVLGPGGRCVFSFFLLDNYVPSRPRRQGFNNPRFEFNHEYGGHRQDFATVEPSDPERMTAYRRSLIERLAREAGLRLVQEPLPGYWSGAFDHWIGAQDVVVLERP
jgi:SAM-dependent methyltransferase